MEEYSLFFYDYAKISDNRNCNRKWLHKCTNCPKYAPDEGYNETSLQCN